MTTAPRPVVVADVRPVVAVGLAAGLAEHPQLQVTGVVSTEPELVAALDRAASGLVVVPLGTGPDLLDCSLRTAPRGTDVVVVGTGRLPGPHRAPGPVRAVLSGTCTVAELAAALAALGGSRPDAPDRGPSASGRGRGGPARHRDELARLTARERQVLALLAQGRSTAEMAAALGVSVNTVRTHVNVLLHKLGVHSRLRAVALYADLPPVPLGPGER